MFVVMSVSKKQLVRVRNCNPPLKDELELSWADGMVGVLPVFDNREDAEEYADGANIIEIEPGE